MYVRPATFLALLIALSGAANIYRSKPVKLCNLPEAISVPGLQSTTVRGCSRSFSTPLVSIEYDIRCQPSNHDSCHYSTYLSSDDGCLQDRPPVPKSFLSESVCETSADPVQTDCSFRLQVPAASANISQVCVVVSCLSAGGCPVNATIRLEGEPIVKEAAEIQEQIGQEYPKETAYVQWVLIGFAAVVLLIIVAAIIWFIQKRRQSKSLSEIQPGTSTTGIWVLATGEDYDNRGNSTRDPTINDM